MCLARDQAKQTPAAMPAPVQRQTWTDDNSSKPHAAAQSSASPASSSSSAFPNRPPLHTEELPDADPELRLREFALIYATYMTYLACRRNYGFWLPSVLTRLGKTKGEAGAIGSSFEMSYGACSLLNGVLIDAVSPRKLLISGLLLTGLINLCVGEVDYLPAIALLWASNGAVQSVGWPSVTNIFLAWFPDPAARGAWYSLLSTCQNAGAALVPLVVAAAISHTGWKAALWAPAALSACTALVLAVWLHGSPAEARRHARAKQLKRSGGGADDASNGSSSNTSSPKLTPVSPRSSLASVLGRQVVLNRSLWVMAINYFGVSLVRSYLSDWSSVYLTEAKGLPLSHVARCLFLLEAGGFGGSLAAGAVSDSVFEGRRGPVVAICSAMLAPLILLLRVTQSPYSLQAIYCGLGFFAFPVHVLLGLFSREVVPAAVSSSAGGFVKCIAQIGGAAAGYPLGRLQQAQGWDGVQVALAVVSFASGITACSLWTKTAAGRIAGRSGTVNDFASMGAPMGGGGSSASRDLASMGGGGGGGRGHRPKTD